MHCQHKQYEFPLISKAQVLRLIIHKIPIQHHRTNLADVPLMGSEKYINMMERYYTEDHVKVVHLLPNIM